MHKFNLQIKCIYYQRVALLNATNGQKLAINEINNSVRMQCRAIALGLQKDSVLF